MSEFRQGYLRGVGTMASSPADLLQGEYDLIVLSSSWDRRSICVAQANALRGVHGIVFLFTTRDGLGLRDKHDRILHNFAESNFREHTLIEGESADFRRLWKTLESHLVDTRTRVGHPLKILIDLSTCPRYFSLGLIARSLKSGLADRVSLFYAEGEYPEENSAEDRHELFTVGGWEAVAVPGLEGDWDPAKNRMYLVSVGFEGSKTLRLISRAEPDRVAVLFPDPGVKQIYVQRTMTNNKPLFDAFRVQPDTIIRAPAGDAISAWSAIATASSEKEYRDNLYYVCCGSKAHSLALALQAIVLRTAAVLYIAPDRHRVADVRPLGVYWRFDIADLSSLHHNNERD